MTGRVYWVSPDIDDWRVQTDGVDEGIFDARDDAVAWACRVARHRAPSVVRVEDYHGNITEQFDFAGAA